MSYYAQERNRERLSVSHEMIKISALKSGQILIISILHISIVLCERPRKYPQPGSRASEDINLCSTPLLVVFTTPIFVVPLYMYTSARVVEGDGLQSRYA